MTTAQRKTIFGISKGLGMDNDELHIMVSGLAGCESLKDLDDKQTDIVLRELHDRNRYHNNNAAKKPAPKEKPETVPGMMTAEQQSLAWSLMYRIRDLDEKPKLHENGKPYTVGERMAGAIHTILGITARPGKNIFNWVDFKNGAKLIEGLKRYLLSAERKAERRKTNDNG